MRLAVCSFLVACGMFLAGCGGDSAPPTTAGAPPPGGPPSGPPMPGDGGPPPAAAPEGGAPAEGTPPTDGTTPMPGGEGTPAAQLPGDSPLNTEGAPQTTSTPDGATPLPGDAANPNTGEPGAPENTPAPPPRPKTIREQSFAAFQSGDDALGTKLLHAHFAMVPAAKDELLQKMGWYPELKRPALAPRIGIAVHFSEVPQNFRAHPMPIGSAELASAVDSLQSGSGAGGGGAGGNTSSGRASGRSSRGARGEGTDSGEKSAADTIQDQPAAEQLSYYLGEFGESLLDALDERMETGEYGPVLQELVKQAAASPSHAGDGQAGENALGTEQAAPPPAAEEGRLAGRGRRAGTSAAQAEGVAAPGSEQGASTKRWSAKSTSAKDTSTPTVSVLLMQLSPCVIWLGKGNAIGEITKRAEAADIDVLAVFSLSLKENRTGVVNNTTTLRIHNLRTQKLISSSPEPLANVAVYNKRKKDDKATDPVKSEVLKALTAIDPVLKPAPLPARTADVAKQRIAFLVSTKPEEPLPVVVEARLYLTKGLMTEDEFLSTAKTLLGDDGFAKLAARAAEGDQ